MKQLALDRYALLDSPIHRWEQRSKFVGLFSLILAFSVVRDWRLLPAMYAVTAGVFALSALPLPYLQTRLKLPGYFIAFMVILLPFISGATVLWQIGPFAIHQEGLMDAWLIASRFICIITVTLVLFGTAPFLSSVKTLRALGLPDILTDMLLLTYRYLFEAADMLQSMRTAVRLRGFEGSKLNTRNLTTLAALIGTMLVRSYEQSEQVYKAMVLRGYGFRKVGSDTTAPGTGDILLCAAAVGVALALVLAQFYLSRTFGT